MRILKTVSRYPVRKWDSHVKQREDSIEAMGCDSKTDLPDPFPGIESLTER